MSKVSITVNDRAYAIGCEPGQEEQVRRLGAMFNDRVAELARQVGQIGDLRLFLMASLTLADELQEARDKCAAAEAHVRNLRNAGESAGAGYAEELAELEVRAAAALDKAAEQVEDILRSLDEE